MHSTPLTVSCFAQPPPLSFSLRAVIGEVIASDAETLRTRARIHIPDGANLIGVVDSVESGILESGQVFVQIRRPGEPTPCIITGPVLIVKQPCLHPGDVLQLQAVDCASLHHLFDVVVFPQKGERPHAEETSGGDLDGDEFQVIWDSTLIPPTYMPPGSYASSTLKERVGDKWWSSIPKQLPFTVSRACFLWPKQCVRQLSSGTAGPCVTHRTAPPRLIRGDERGAQVIAKCMDASRIAAADDGNANGDH